MSVVRFLADTHFGHEKMALHRGFKTVEEHDQYIIDKWNSVVHRRDTTYLLGDVTMESKKYYHLLDKLNGRKIVILGNHDMKNHIPELLKHVDQVAALVKYSVKGYPKVFLSHCPVHPTELDYRVKFNIHGHVHEKTVRKFWKIKDKRYICVSCEHVDYTPKTLKELFDGNK